MRDAEYLANHPGIEHAERERSAKPGPTSNFAQLVKCPACKRRQSPRQFAEVGGKCNTCCGERYAHA